MDFLSQASAQLTDLFKSMTPGARITSGLLLAVVLISLVYLFGVQVASPDCDLMNGEPVRNSHLTSMKAAFGKAGLNSYEIRGTQILIPRGQRDRYMAALADGNALPPNIHTVLRKAIQDTSPFLTKQQQADRMKIAIQETLALIISQMRGIENAYVLYTTEITGTFRKDKTTTASVSIKPAVNERLDDAQVSAIRHLVAAAIAGKPAQVNVIDLNGSIHYGGDSENGVSAHENIYAVLKRSYEQEWKAKILNTLSYIPGIKVTPNVELDRDRINRTTSIKYDAKPVALQQLDESSSSKREGAGPGGRPGFVSQGAVLNTSATLAGSRAAGSTEDTEESKTVTTSVPSTEQTELEKLGFTPQRVTVSITVPSSHYEKLWTKRNPPEEGQQPQTPDENALTALRQEVETTVKKTVAILLPQPTDGTEATDLVTVAVLDDLKAPEIPGPGLGENAMAWFGQYWTTLGMIGVAMFSLVILRSMVRTGPGVPEGKGLSATSPGDEADEESPEEAALNRLGRFSGSGPSLRDELGSLIQEDPDAAANILKTWIGTAG